MTYAHICPEIHSRTNIDPYYIREHILQLLRICGRGIDGFAVDVYIVNGRDICVYRGRVDVDACLTHIIVQEYEVYFNCSA